MASPAGLAGFDVVVPTVGRASLTALLLALDAQAGPLPERLILVDDRADPAPELAVPALSEPLRTRLFVLRTGGRGPAAARNAGWRAGGSPWVAFLDDDVVPASGWLTALERDLRDAPRDVAGSQARLIVPLPHDRPPTDWERNVASLERADWITADMAYRRDALEATGGFDERFRRAFREDTDLALRVRALGLRVERGCRTSLHPVPPADRWVSVRLQRGNADDALMAALHPGWRDAPRGFGRRPWHIATVAALLAAAIAAAFGAPVAAVPLALAWLGSTAALTWRRIAPGPRTASEAATILTTSMVIPFAACGWWAIGLVRRRRLLAAGRSGEGLRPARSAAPPSIDDGARIQRVRSA